MLDRCETLSKVIWNINRFIPLLVIRYQWLFNVQIVFTWGPFEVALVARPFHALDKVKSKITLIKWNWVSKSGELECFYGKLYLFYFFYLFKAYVKIILSSILDGFHAICSWAFDQRLASPSSYAAFILPRAKCCLNTGAPAS